MFFPVILFAMNRVILFFTVGIIFGSLLFSSKINAQSNHPSQYDFGVSYTNIFLGSADGGLNKKYEVGLYGEWQRTISKAFSLGARINYSYGPAYCYNVEASGTGSAHYLEVLGVATFNLLRNKFIFPYISVGLGPAAGFDTVISYKGHLLASASVRVGIDLFQHIRAGVGCTLSYDVINVGLSPMFEPAYIFVGYRL